MNPNTSQQKEKNIFDPEFSKNTKVYLSKFQEKRLQFLEEDQQRKRNKALNEIRKLLFETQNFHKQNEEVENDEDETSSQQCMFEEVGTKTSDLDIEGDLIKKIDKVDFDEERKDQKPKSMKSKLGYSLPKRKALNFYAKQLAVPDHMISPPSKHP